MRGAFFARTMWLYALLGLFTPRGSPQSSLHANSCRPLQKAQRRHIMCATGYALIGVGGDVPDAPFHVHAKHGGIPSFLIYAHARVRLSFSHSLWRRPPFLPTAKWLAWPTRRDVKARTFRLKFRRHITRAPRLDRSKTFQRF